MATVTETTDATANISTSYSINVDDTFTGEITSAADKDWVGVQLQKGVKYDVTLDYRSGILDFNSPFVSFYDGSGTLLTSSGDGGENDIAHFWIEIKTTGTYFIGSDINPSDFFGGSGTGLYDLTIAENVVGGSGRDTMVGENSANDLLRSGGGRDTLKGLSGNDQLEGGSGRDKLFGGDGSDVLLGGAGNDKLVGGNGDDTLKGGSGDDTMQGGRGDDKMKGGSGKDTFVFEKGDDVVRDFAETLAGEKIDLSNAAGIKSFRDLKNNHLTDLNGNAVIEDTKGNTMTLNGASAADLDRADFIF